MTDQSRPGLDLPTPIGQPAGEEADFMEDALLPDPAQKLGAMEQDRGVDLPPWAPMDVRQPAEDGLRAFQDLVDHITYKPNYRLAVLRDQVYGAEAGARFRLTFRQPNTYRPHETIDLMQMFVVPHWLLDHWGTMLGYAPDKARQRMLRWVRKALGWHELHERDEWIRVDGAMPFDPHQGDPTRFRLDA